MTSTNDDQVMTLGTIREKLTAFRNRQDPETQHDEGFKAVLWDVCKVLGMNDAQAASVTHEPVPEPTHWFYCVGIYTDKITDVQRMTFAEAREKSLEAEASDHTWIMARNIQLTADEQGWVRP